MGMKNSKRTFVAALVFGLSVLAAGCSDSDETSKSTVQKTPEQAHLQSMKAAAEAEAAEEEFAKAKLAQTDSASKKAGKNHTRGVASVPKATAKKAKAVDSVYVVQVGTFKVEENAKNIVAKLKSAGLPVFQKKVERGGGAVLYAVRLEPTSNRKEAEQFLANAKAATGESPLILSMER